MHNESTGNLTSKQLLNFTHGSDKTFGERSSCSCWVNNQSTHNFTIKQLPNFTHGSNETFGTRWWTSNLHKLLFQDINAVISTNKQIEIRQYPFITKVVGNVYEEARWMTCIVVKRLGCMSWKAKLAAMLKINGMPVCPKKSHISMNLSKLCST